MRLRGGGMSSVDEYEKMVKNDKQNNGILSDFERFYWENRSGCWLSDIHQSIDLVENIDVIQLCNCRKILELLHAYPWKDRLSKKHQRMLVKRMSQNLVRNFEELPYSHLWKPMSLPYRAFRYIKRRVCKLLSK